MSFQGNSNYSVHNRCNSIFQIVGGFFKEEKKKRLELTLLYILCLHGSLHSQALQTTYLRLTRHRQNNAIGNA